MSLADYLTGAAHLLAVLGCVLGAAVVLANRRLAHLSGPPRVLGISVLATSGLLLVHLIPGALGILTRGTVLGCAALVLLASLVVDRGRDRASVVDQPSPPEPAGPLSAVLAGAAVGLAAVAFVAVAVHARHLAVSNADATTFHLTQSARWLQSQSLWAINSFSPNWAYGAEPNTGDLLQLAFILPWHGDAFVRLPDLVLLVVAAMSVYALGRELGAPTGASATLAAVFTAMPSTLFTALDANLPDVVVLATFGPGVLFLLRHVRTGLTSELVLAGLGLGLSFGTRWYAPPAVVTVIGIWLAAQVPARRPWRELGRQTMTVVVMIGAAGGFWLLRNWIELGNPVFPAKVSLFGLTIFDAPHDRLREQLGFSLAHYVGRLDVWRDWILPAWKLGYGYSVGLVGIGLALSFALAWRWRRDPAGRGRQARTVLAVAIAGAALGLVYIVTPFTASGPEGQPNLIVVSARYWSPGLLVAAAVAAWTAGRLRRGGLVLQAVGATLIIHSAVRIYPTWTAHRLSVYAPRYVGYAVGIAVLLLLGRLILRRLMREPRPASALAGAGVVAALALALLVGLGYRHQRSFFATRYRGLDPTFDWVLDHASSHHRIALAGLSAPWDSNSAPWPMYGPRLTNRVAYVGPVVRGLLRTYASRGPFVSALTGGRYELLLIGRYQRNRSVVEESWARGAGWVPVADSGRYVLLRAPPFAASTRLDASGRVGG